MKPPRKHSANSKGYYIYRLHELVRERPDDSLADYARTLGICPSYVGDLIRNYQIPYEKKESFRRKKSVPKQMRKKIPASHQKQIMLIAMEARMRGLSYGQLVASGYELGKDGDRYAP